MTVQIHGNNYVTVSERVAAIHKSGKSFEITESLPIQVGDRWVWRCTCKVDGLTYIGSAEVHLGAKPGSADATDPLACAETSAVGRALGFAGVLSLEGIASADEIVRVQPTTDHDELGAILAEVKSLGLVKTKEQWIAWKRSVLGAEIANANLTREQIVDLRSAIEEYKLANVSGAA